MMNQTRRAALFKLLCVSLFSSNTMAFSNQRTMRQLTTRSSHDFAADMAPAFNAYGETSSRLKMTASATAGKKLKKKKKTAKTLAHSANRERLTAEEETELLRQAVEFKRLQALERDLTLKSPTRELPLVSIRAKAAGYGDEILEYEDAMEAGQTARETLVTRSMGLVHFAVSQILSKRKNKRLNSLSYDDLVQEGAIGLARAVDKWNPDIGGRLSTYAIYWVRASIYRCIAERDDMLRVPNHISQAVRDVNKAARRLGMDLDAPQELLPSGMSSSWKEASIAKRLAEEAGLSDRNFQEAMKARSRRYSGGYVAFESWMQKGEDMQGDVPIPRDDQDASTMQASLKTEHLRTTLAKYLRPKEMEALSWRYGLVEDHSNSVDESSETTTQKANRYLAEAEQELFGSVTTPKKAALPAKGRWGEAMSFTEVGNKMHVSAEYGRRLCHAALAKLKRAAEEGRLEPALLY